MHLPVYAPMPQKAHTCFDFSLLLLLKSAFSFGKHSLSAQRMKVHSTEAIHKSIEDMRLESDIASECSLPPSAQTKEQKPEYWHSPTPTHMVKYRCCLQPHSCIETLSPMPDRVNYLKLYIVLLLYSDP